MPCLENNSSISSPLSQTDPRFSKRFLKGIVSKARGTSGRFTSSPVHRGTVPPTKYSPRTSHYCSPDRKVHSYSNLSCSLFRHFSCFTLYKRPRSARHNLLGTNGAEGCQRAWPSFFPRNSPSELLTSFTRTTGNNRHLQVRKLEAFLFVLFYSGDSTKHLVTLQADSSSLP